MTDPDAPNPLAEYDGRALRRQRNIDNVLDAVLDLAGDGQFDPTSEEIAERAGVSHRSLYRYFPDRTTLIRHAIDRVTVRIAPLLEIPDLGEGALERRIEVFVAARVDTYIGFGPIARTAFSGLGEPAVRDGIETSRSVLCGQLVAQFEPELDRLNHSERARTVALLDAAFQFEALEYLSAHCQLDVDDVKWALETHLRAHLLPLTER